MGSGGGGSVVGNAAIHLTTQAAGSVSADTIVVVGGRIDPMQEPANVAALRHAAIAADSVASICTGAFLLAAAGSLDPRRATTHWQFARTLQDRYPHVMVDADRIFINDGPIWTSAGMTAGIDLMLARIEFDRGPDIAKSVSRELVVYHRRPGGQSQYAAILEMEPRTDRIRKVLTFAGDHLSEPLPIDRLADAACLSVRQFARLFRKETGETPAARTVGFADPERMRCAFVRSYGHAPQTQRRLDQSIKPGKDGSICWPPSRS